MGLGPALVLIATTGASWLIFTMGAGGLHFLIALLIVTALTLIVPNRSLTPTHDGTSLLGAALGRRPLPGFPTRLAIGMIPPPPSAASSRCKRPIPSPASGRRWRCWR